MNNTGPTLDGIPARTLRRRRKALVAKLPPLELLLRGSLIERYKRCGYAGCRCQRGRGHGPKYYLSIGKRWIRYRYEIPAPELRGPEELTVAQVAEHFGVSHGVVYYWIERDILPARRVNRGSPYWITLDDAKENRLQQWVRDSSRIATNRN